jgi:hypothetical protein
VYVGQRRTVAPPTSCTVVADTWPGWLLVLPSHGFRCSHLLVPDLSAPWLPFLLQLHPDCRVSALSLELSLASTHYAFGQGTTFAAEVLQRSAFPVWFFSADTGWSGPPTFGFRLFHPDYGGVLSGEWEFWSSSEQPSRLPSAPSKEGRTLSHIVDPATRVARYTPCAPPLPSDTVPGVSVRWLEADAETLDGRGLLPSKEVFCRVRCPCVFSPTRWVIRPLTLKEVLGVYDLSEGLLSCLTGVEPPPFVDSAPGRLLGAVLGLLDHPGRPLVQIGQEKKRDRINLGQEGTMEEAPSWPSVPGTMWTGTSESTTKADDAKAHTTLWDLRVLGRTKPDRCQYTQFEARFGFSCLDAIRNFLLRAWRRKVFKSLCQYLAETRGSADTTRCREVGRDALCKAAQATWWDWTGGSTPFFWRWPPYA